MKNKGFYPLFTTLGLVLVIIVVAIAIQWNAKGDKAYESHIDRLSWLRIDHAVGNVRQMASDSLRDLFYDAIASVGEIREGTMNPYLNYSTLEDGWDAVVEAIRQNVSGRFKDVVPSLADYSDGNQNTFVFEEGINVTIGELRPSDLGIQEAGDEIVGVVELPMTVTNRYQGWEATLFESNITIPLNVRLKDMYERAWEFNEEYESLASMTFTAALYGRAWANAYCLEALERLGLCSSSGPFLKEPNYDFDPIATLLFGDLQTIKDFADNIGSILNTGAIPAATYFAEWQHLSEPSFLPPGFDLTNGDAAEAREVITGNYNLEQAGGEACIGSSASQPAVCDLLFDHDALDDEISAVEDQASAYDNVLHLIDEWFNTYDVDDYVNCELLCDNKYPCETKYKNCIAGCVAGGFGKSCRRSCKDQHESCEDKLDKCEDDGKEDACRLKVLNKMFPLDQSDCDEFRENTLAIIEGLNDQLKQLDDEACKKILDDAESKYINRVNVDPRVDGVFEENNMSYGIHDTRKYCVRSLSSLSDLNSIASSDLLRRKLSDSMCLNNKIGDCEDPGNECNKEEYCGSCRYPSCPGDGRSYTCTGDFDVGRPDRKDVCEECSTNSRGRRVCDKENYYIDQCKCRCRPRIELLLDIFQDLVEVRFYLEKTATALEKTAENFESQQKAMEDASKLLKKAEDLAPKKLGYDVFSRIDTDFVGYDKGEIMDGKFCYYDPDFENRDDGVCGDSVESGIMYTVQIAAAALATLFSGGTAAPLLNYAKDFFPMIFESGVKYNLTETLIDDGNRVMLTNVADGGELYVYAPFEFEIYENKEFEIGSATFNRVIVYVYLPSAGGLDRVMEGLLDKSCKGDTCKE